MGRRGMCNDKNKRDRASKRQRVAALTGFPRNEHSHRVAPLPSVYKYDGPVIGKFNPEVAANAVFRQLPEPLVRDADSSSKWKVPHWKSVSTRAMKQDS